MAFLLTAQAGDVGEENSRSRFAARLSDVMVGESKEAVRRLLGAPDSVIKRNDDGERLVAGEVWHYGVAGDARFPTLGRVYFTPVGDEQVGGGGLVQLICGQGAPHSSVLKIPEAKLRSALAAMGGVPLPDAFEYDPRRVITAVNALSEFKTESIADILDEYVRVSSSDGADSSFKVQLLLAVLLDPDLISKMPTRHWGQLIPAMPEPKAPGTLYPIVLCDDVPFLLIRGRVVQGWPPNAAEYLGWFRTHGRLRPLPLSPSREPWILRAKLRATKEWKSADRTDDDLAHVNLQILLLMNADEEQKRPLRLIKQAFQLNPDDAWERWIEQQGRVQHQWNQSRGKLAPSP